LQVSANRSQQNYAVITFASPLAMNRALSATHPWVVRQYGRRAGPGTTAPSHKAQILQNNRQESLFVTTVYSLTPLTKQNKIISIIQRLNLVKH
jgi:hypothetical protein